VKRYLSKISLSEAITILTTSFPLPDRREIVTVDDATGRILASPVYANATIPAARLASMDGIAVTSQETLDARDQNPIQLTNAVSISTGQVVPPMFDAVIASEEIWFEGGENFQIRRPARIGQNIREPGEEVKAGRLILHPGHRIIPSDLGALITYGIREVEVRSLVVGLIPTGDELVHGDQDPKPGQVRESNTAVIAASLIQVGIKAVRYSIIPDDPDKIRDAISTAAKNCDLVLISAGSSGGRRDHTREVIEELGSILFHGVAMRPGKTVLCGKIDTTPVIGLPGQPMASLTSWREIVIPLLRFWGVDLQQNPESSALTAEPIPSDGGIDEFIPVSIVRVLGEDYVFPRPRGAAGQMQAVRSNAVLHIPAVKEGYREGIAVTVRLTRQHQNEQSILIAGISDSLTDHLQAMFITYTSHLIIRPLSAIGAAAALCKGTCHGIFITGSATTSESNVSKLLKSGCRDQIRSVAVGCRDGELTMLLFRNTPAVTEAISPLMAFLSSDAWKIEAGLPEIGIPEETISKMPTPDPGSEYGEQTISKTQRIRS